ncbi:MAG: SDR family NAD(P)-dependent oxidoreductase [Candidatus Velthaea sp.]
MPQRAVRRSIPAARRAPRSNASAHAPAARLAYFPLYRFPVYSAAKAALHSVIRSMRAKVPSNVTVLEVLPPFVDTPLVAHVAAMKIFARATAPGIRKVIEREHREARIGIAALLPRGLRLAPATTERILQCLAWQKRPSPEPQQEKPTVNTPLVSFAAAGAGAVAMQVVQYGDMALTRRKPSDVPPGIAVALGRLLGHDLNNTGEADEDRRRASRREAIGELLGFATLVSFGLAYGYLRRDRSAFSARAAAALGLGAMLSTEVLASALGVSNPVKWKPNEWASELAPHLAYGAVTALMYAALAP